MKPVGPLEELIQFHKRLLGLHVAGALLVAGNTKMNKALSYSIPQELKV